MPLHIMVRLLTASATIALVVVASRSLLLASPLVRLNLSMFKQCLLCVNALETTVKIRPEGWAGTSLTTTSICSCQKSLIASKTLLCVTSYPAPLQGLSFSVIPVMGIFPAGYATAYINVSLSHALATYYCALLLYYTAIRLQPLSPILQSTCKLNSSYRNTKKEDLQNDSHIHSYWRTQNQTYKRFKRT